MHLLRLNLDTIFLVIACISFVLTFSSVNLPEVVGLWLSLYMEREVENVEVVSE